MLLGGFTYKKGRAPKLGDLSASVWGRRAGLPPPRHPKQWWLSHGKHPEPLPLLSTHAGHHLRPGQGFPWGRPHTGNMPALPLPKSHFALPAAAHCPAGRKVPVMVPAAGCCLPATWGRYPPAQGVHGSPGAMVLLEHPWLWEKLSLWPSSAGASCSLGWREQV